MVVTSTLQTLRCFSLQAISKLNRMKSIKRTHGGNLVYIQQHDFVASSGKYPHCRIYKASHRNFKTIYSINYELKIDEKCNDMVYVDAEDHLIMAFNTLICVYDLKRRIFVQEMTISHECLSLCYLQTRKILLLGIAKYRLELYKYSGVGTLSLEKRIELKGNKPISIIHDEEESQLLIASNETFLETCELEDKKTSELGPKFKIKVNSLVYFKEQKKIIASGDGNNIFVLGLK
jgi:hypothetical protein